MRLIVLFIIIFLHGCNPQKMEKLGKKEIAQSRKIIANNRLLTPPNINWKSDWNLRYQGTINRHN